jgi:tRNA(His) 5'-end guanylyltransferase
MSAVRRVVRAEADVIHERRVMTRDSLGDRMKQNYERPARATLPLRMPVMLRVDGKAFHTYCRDLVRPFDESFMAAMDACAVAICTEAQGAVIAYVQSDEINILLHNYKRLDTAAWFNNDLQKIVSVSASIASMTMTAASVDLFGRIRPAAFDARAFVLPESEVANAFLWREQDAARNSVTMVAQTMFRESELIGRTTAERQEMIFQKSGKNWNDLPTHMRRGRCIVRETKVATRNGVEVTRSQWVVDREIPLFSKDRDYIERHLVVEDESPRTEPRFGEQVESREHRGGNSMAETVQSALPGESPDRARVVAALEALAIDLIQGGDNPSIGRKRYIAEGRKEAVAALSALVATSEADRIAKGVGGHREAMDVLALAETYKRDR